MSAHEKKFEGYVKLAADCVAELRASDLERVLSEASTRDELALLGTWLIERRPELEERILQESRETMNERGWEWPSAEPPPVRAKRRVLGVPREHAEQTAALRSMKLKAKDEGDFHTALVSAGYYAKKQNQMMYAFKGNSYGHEVWRVVAKSSDACNRVNNSAGRVVSVSPDLTVAYHDVEEV
jgi:hypothetical protein